MDILTQYCPCDNFFSEKLYFKRRLNLITSFISIHLQFFNCLQFFTPAARWQGLLV